MKKILFILMSLFAIATSANAMSYEQARDEALFLTDKMAYELNLTDAQYEAAYEINLDYLMSVTNRDNVFGLYWERRNLDIQYVLYSWQWDAFCAATYFYRPLFWEAGCWHFGIYVRYPHRDYFYFGRPHCYVSYRGGHSWRMNGGCSYYKVHCAVYRPHIVRGRHIGMRDGWNRGSYRSGRRGYSSTRVTGSFRDNRGTDRANTNSGNRMNDRLSQSRLSDRKDVRSIEKKGDFSKMSRTNSASMSAIHSYNFNNRTAEYRASGNRASEYRASGNRASGNVSARSNVGSRTSTMSGFRSQSPASSTRSGSVSSRGTVSSRGSVSRGNGTRSSGRQH